jgi:hypothetical protein
LYGQATAIASALEIETIPLCTAYTGVPSGAWMSTPLWKESGLSKVASTLPRKLRGSPKAPRIGRCRSNGLIGHW